MKGPDAASMMRLLRRACVGGCMLLVVCAGINAYLIFSTRGLIYEAAADTAVCEAVLVPGAMVYRGGGLSHVLEDRLESARALYARGAAGKLLLSGDHGTRYYDEVNSMKRHLLSQGVPAEDIFLDHAGFETYDSIYRAAEVFGVKRMVICTQRFHLYRALYIARALGLEAYGVAADRRVYRGWMLNETREFFARIKAFFKILLRPAPKFLGAHIPISGDGRKSWD
jgi:SanA protein